MKIIFTLSLWAMKCSVKGKKSSYSHSISSPQHGKEASKGDWILSEFTVRMNMHLLWKRSCVRGFKYSAILVNIDSSLEIIKALCLHVIVLETAVLPLHCEPAAGI